MRRASHRLCERRRHPAVYPTGAALTRHLAGLVLSPGGFALIGADPIVTALVEVVQTRYVIGFGFLVLGFGLIFGSIIITPDVDFRTRCWRGRSSAGFGFLLVRSTPVDF